MSDLRFEISNLRFQISVRKSLRLFFKSGAVFEIQDFKFDI